MSRALFRRVMIAVISVAAAGAAVPLLAGQASANLAGTGLVINEAYVNGGSSGASYLNKFVELFNPTSSAISLTGDTLQYRAPTSTVVPSGAQVFTLTGTVAAHGHFLIQLPSNGASSNPGAALPTPDLSTGGSVNPGAGGGTLFVAASAVGVLPTDAVGHRQDRLGYQQLAGGHRPDRQLDRPELPAGRGRHGHRQQRGRLPGRHPDPAGLGLRRWYDHGHGDQPRHPERDCRHRDRPDHAHRLRRHRALHLDRDRPARTVWPSRPAESSRVPRPRPAPPR